VVFLRPGIVSRPLSLFWETKMLDDAALNRLEKLYPGKCHACNLCPKKYRVCFSGIGPKTGIVFDHAILDVCIQCRGKAESNPEPSEVIHSITEI
jgi:hypothetical protein